MDWTSERIHTLLEAQRLKFLKIFEKHLPSCLKADPFRESVFSSYNTQLRAVPTEM